MLFAKFKLKLTPSKFLDSKSDTLSEISIENIFSIHFLWQLNFLRKHGKGYFDVFTVCFDIFLKTSFATGFVFHKKQFYLKTWCVVILLNQNLTRWKNLLSKTDDYWKCWLEHSLVKKNWSKNCFLFHYFFSVLFSSRKHQTANFEIFTV